MSASFFRDSQNFHIENGTFVTASSYNNLSGQTTPFDKLCQNIAEEAMHDSSERSDAPKVHPETRKAVQEEILCWIEHGNEDPEPKKLLWVSGPAGAGKTAIAGSLTELCEEEGFLAGSFFFSFAASKKRRSKQHVVATLAYCLLQHDSLQALRQSILSMIGRDPMVFGKALRDQCKAFLLRPFYDARGHLDLSTLPKVIILDGLDEVEADDSRQLDKYEARSANEDDQVEILAMLLRAAQDPKFPFRIIVFSRPERVISNFFDMTASHISRQIFLDDKYDPDSDIGLFLRAKFSLIRARYKIGEGWPSRDQIQQLVANASGQFIYAATVIRFLESGKHPDPQSLLRSILKPSRSEQPLNALAPLDSLYTRILMSSPDPPLAVRWICVGDSDWSNVGAPTAKFIRQLFQDYEGQEGYLLENLASLVHTPTTDKDESGYEFYHKSMLDFLRSPQRCGQLLNDSYNSSMKFFCDRWLGVLRAKRTSPPLPDSEWGKFVSCFWNFHLHVHTRLQTGFEEPFLACDAAGWVRIIGRVGLIHHQEAILGGIFRFVHDATCAEATRSGSIHCSKLCLHWRSAILGECKRMGWNTPAPIGMLLELMHEEANDLYDATWFLERRRAESPCGRSVLVASPSSGGMESLAYKRADLEEYEELLVTLKTISTALPEGWVRSYEQLRRWGRPKEIAAKAQLIKVRPEVRLQMKGLDEWLGEGWSGEETNPVEVAKVEEESSGSEYESFCGEDEEPSGSEYESFSSAEEEPEQVQAGRGGRARRHLY